MTKVITNNMLDINKRLLRLDCAVLKSDSKITKLVKRKILKPVGFYFRKKNFDNLM